MVIKRDGRRQSFDRKKIIAGLLKACEKRPVSVERLEELAAQVERAIQKKFDREVESREIGEMVMSVLADLDEVAYVRFASVYRRFDEAGDFVQAVKKLEVRHDTATLGLPGISDIGR